MSEMEQFCERARSMQRSLLNGFAAIGGAIQPAIEAFRVFALHCNANRKARRAIARGNVAKWNWYTREHLRRHSEAINSGSQDHEAQR